jgi:hypothetical protein
MKVGLVVLAVAAVVTTATLKPSEARSYRHYGYCTHFLLYDYTHSNALSPMSYIYPAANWGPFFQCHVYLAPIVYLPASPAPY